MAHLKPESEAYITSAEVVRALVLASTAAVAARHLHIPVRNPANAKTGLLLGLGWVTLLPHGCKAAQDVQYKVATAHCVIAPQTAKQQHSCQYCFLPIVSGSAQVGF